MLRYIIFLVGFCASSLFYSQNINFRAVFNNKPLILNSNIPFEGSYINVKLFKLYISNIEFTYKDGSSFKETNSYHLIDLANSNDCELLITDAKKGISQLSFDIGIDSATNSVDAVTFSQGEHLKIEASPIEEPFPNFTIVVILLFSKPINLASPSIIIKILF